MKKEGSTGKKLFSLFMSAVLVWGMVPLPANAEDEPALDRSGSEAASVVAKTDGDEMPDVSAGTDDGGATSDKDPATTSMETDESAKKDVIQVADWTGLQEAIDAAEANQVVQLSNNVVCAEDQSCIRVEGEDKSVTIDLNGHTLDRNLTSKREDGQEEAQDDGHVVAIRAGATLTIVDSSATDENPGTGTITGGWATSGGGIFVGEGTTLNLKGGSVTGNYASEHGAGIYVCEGVEKVSVQGRCIVWDNIVRSGGVSDGDAPQGEATPAASDVCLPSGFRLEVAGALAEDARIGISMEGEPGTFTEDYGLHNEEGDPALHFSSNQGYRVLLQDGEAALALSDNNEPETLDTPTDGNEANTPDATNPPTDDNEANVPQKTHDENDDGTSQKPAADGKTNGDGEDAQGVTKNYDITVKNSKLTIAQNPNLELTVSLNSASYPYDFSPHTLPGEATTNALNGETTIEYSKDGSTWTTNMASLTATNVADSCTIRVRATNPNYTNTAEASANLSIQPANINDAVVAPLLAHEYTGKPLEPKPLVQYKGVQLQEDVDYTLVYADNIDPGTAHVTITGKGNFTGTITKDFTITASDYFVRFDANVPATASTTCAGTMEDQRFQYDEKKELLKNGYTLPGYEFDGWNTKADGSGAPYTDEAEVQRLTKDGGTVTLYAQWRALEYTIYFQSGDEGSLPHEQTATFDQAGKLEAYSDAAFVWSSSGRTLFGWTGPAFGSFYADGEDFFNLCGLPMGNGNLSDVTLTASWVQNGQIVVAVTKDDVPQAGLNSGFKLVGGNGTEYTVGMTYGSGTYVFDPAQAAASGQGTGQLPQGTYTLRFDAPGYPSSSAQLTYDGSHAAGVVFDYYTVRLEKDSAYATVHDVQISGGEPVEDKPNTAIVLDDGTLGINTIVYAGYHFDRYSALGVEPRWEVDPPSEANQTVVVQGKAAIMAHVRANVYKAHFDANARSGVSGSMEDQDMVYDQPQRLFANGFSREGHDFVGWNTKADGSGKAYADEQSVENLTTENGGTVTLYAQWKIRQHTIRFVNEDGAELQSGQVAYGQTPEYKGETPTKAATAQYTYEFGGWTPELVAVTGDATYTATYIPVVNKYKVTFVDYDGKTVLKEATDYEYGTPADKVERPADPKREADAQYTYEFSGWSPAVTDVTGDATYTATYTQTPIPTPTPTNIGTLTFNLGGGTLDGKTGTITIEANVGDTITIPDAPTREGYTFKYWKGSEYYPGDKYKVEGDHTFTAVWEKSSSPADNDISGNKSSNTGNTSTTSGGGTTSSGGTTTSSVTAGGIQTPKTGDVFADSAALVALVAFALFLLAFGLHRRRA